MKKGISALIIVDIQTDFCPRGALPVKDGDKVIPLLNSYIKKFVEKGAPIFTTRDWHPVNHISFKGRGGVWPPHCIQNTWGAKFHPELKLPRDATIISKAESPDQEAYSGFQGTALAKTLRNMSVTRVYVGGLATDYCVKNTVLDALKEGFTVFLLIDASRGVNVKPGDSEQAIREMVSRGAKRTTISDIVVI